MPAKCYPVLLDQEQRASLMGLISSGKESARKLTRARILLKADESETGPAIWMPINKSEKLLKFPCLPLSEPVEPSHLMVSPPPYIPKNVRGQDRRSLMATQKRI